MSITDAPIPVRTPSPEVTELSEPEPGVAPAGGAPRPEPGVPRSTADAPGPAGAASRRRRLRYLALASGAVGGAVAMVALAATGTVGLSGGPVAVSALTQAHSETPQVVLFEDFTDDSHRWEAGGASVVDGEYRWHLAAGRQVHTARDLAALGASLHHVTVDTSFTAAAAGLVGINCARSGAYAGGGGYMLGLSPQGAAILKQMPLGTPEAVLASNDAVRLTTAPTLLTAHCRAEADGYHLALEVDHISAVEVVDRDPLPTGAPGLVVAAGDSGPTIGQGDAARHRGLGDTTAGASVRFADLSVSVPEGGPGR